MRRLGTGSTSMSVDWVFVICEKPAFTDLGLWMGTSMLTLESALLLAFENGSKVPFNAGVTENCNSIATTSLISVLATITSTVEPFTLGAQSIDFNFLPPFVTFLVYKAAAIVTQRLLMDSDSNEGLNQLRILRNFLRIVKERWLGCGELSKMFEKGVELTEYV